MPSDPNTAEREWAHIAVEAPPEARCFFCCHPVVGTDYRWRPVFGVIDDMRVSFAHPECLEDVTDDV